MKTILAPALLILAAASANADFSYTTTSKVTGGMMASMAGQAGISQTSKVQLKGRKMKIDSGKVTRIMDFDAQTITSIDTESKTYTVKNFADARAEAKPDGVEIKIDAVETGQKKIVNGFAAGELMLTMEIDAPAQAQKVGKMTVEMDCWISRDVPGVQELRAFYQGMGDRFPWASVFGGGANPGLQQAMAEVQKKFASMDGVPVQQIVRMKMPASMAGMGGGRQGDPMAQMKAKLEAMRAQGGPAAAIAEKQLGRMGGASSSLFEMTVDSSDFSSSAIPDLAFSIPGGYRKAS